MERKDKGVNSNDYSMLIFKVVHFTLDVVLFYFAFIWFRYYTFTDIDPVGFRYNYYVSFGYAVLLYWFSKTYNATLFGFFRVRTLALSQFLSQFFSAGLIAIVVTIAWRRIHEPWCFLILLTIQFVIDFWWAFLGSRLYNRLYPSKRTLLIYRNELDRIRFGAVSGKPIERQYKIEDAIKFDGEFKEIKDKLADYDAVFVAGVNSKCRNDILKYCKFNSLPGFFLPHVGDAIMQGATHIQSFDSPVLFVDKTSIDPLYAFIKRAFDIFASGIAIVILSPVMLVTAIVIRLYDKGPALYKQTRLTKKGREFKILKFRSMRVDAEKNGVARLSTGDKDDRITPVGRFIRKCRIDELPQLFNIFIGDMSIVGPRPERPEIAEQYYETMPDFKLRLQVKAGLTGYAQVYGKYNTDPYEKLEFDLLYINKMSIFTDLQLCFATFFILFQSESTAGIEEGKINAMAVDYEEQDEKK